MWTRNFPSIHRAVSSCRLLHLHNSVIVAVVLVHGDEKQDRKQRYGAMRARMAWATLSRAHRECIREEKRNPLFTLLIGSFKIMQNKEETYWDFIRSLDRLFPSLQQYDMNKAIKL